MEILNEQLNHYLNESAGNNPLNETATPMWMTYMEAFNQFMEQSGKRLERYETYEEMDKYPEIHLALDIISTEIFVFDPITNSPFLFDTNGKIPEASLSRLIKKFTNILKLKEVLPFAVRLSLKFGDSFYFIVKDKEHHMAGLRRIDNKDIDFIEYDEIGIEPLNYYIAKKKIDESQMGSYLQFLKYQNLETASKEKLSSIASKTGDDFYVIPRNMMIRFMNRGQNSKFFPFGESYLESIFPYWKKVSLLEDSLIIYRIVRAPERRVFYIDVGKAPAKIAEKVVTQTKDEIKRRRTAASQENQEMGIASSFNPLSMQEDYFFAQRCLSLNTEIPLLDGRTLSLDNIIKEYEEGKQNFTYSVDEKTGTMIPGEIEWAGITRKNAELVKVTLDTEEEIICTPDHKFVLRDGSYCEAQYLEEGFSLMTLLNDENINNYHCIGVEILLYTEDTGCLTIKDPGNNHNFALAVGVYVKNSDGRGSRVETLPGACLSLDTKIPLLDGRELILSEIINEWENDKEKENWVYSCNPITGELAPGKITWAGITRKNTKVMKITLDNGETITCTPDHKFPIRDIGFVEAQDLVEGQSLIPFRKRFKPISKNRNEYEQVFDVYKNEWVFTHRMVDNFIDNDYTYIIEGKKDTVHHKNFNRFDNIPDNLVKMNGKDHWKLHSDLGFTKEQCVMGAYAAVKARKENFDKNPHLYDIYKEKLRKNKQDYWDNITEEEYNYVCSQMSKSLSEKRKDPQYEEKYIEKQTINAFKGSNARIEKQISDPEFKKDVYTRSGNSLAKRIKTDKVYRKKLLAHLDNIKQPWRNKTTVFDRKLLEMVIDTINATEETTNKGVLRHLNENDEFMLYFQELNKSDGNGIDKRKLDVFGGHHMIKLLKKYNYNGWRDFISKVPNYNHKIVKIEVLDYGIDVGTITVDGNEEIHNFHTFALSSGIYTKNSNLGEIQDVAYFYKKLIAGMRIPPSYFNSENPPTWNDGKVGAALAEEARFGKWLTEIREQYLWDFKLLFLEFLKERGVQLKEDDLEMQWKESINVAENQELEKMVQRQSVFTGFPMEQFSPQYLQKKVLGWSEEEIQENMTSLVKWQKYKDNNNLM